ncbi:AaceriADL106Cp [[Ashbya] aceris (nom. inval.)]|nr:AaceriADL106Cp [[Ashbya] aceris (nom. inval.)]
MSDQQFVHPLGLKSRLVGCLFSPLVVVPTVVYLFTIWTVHTIADSHSAAASSPTLFSAPTLSAPEQSAAPTGGTLWSATPTVDVTALDDAVRRYLNDSLTSSAQTLERYIRDNYNFTVSASLRVWNETLNNSVKLLHDLLLRQQRQNVSIGENLHSQAQRLGRAAAQLSESGFSVGRDLGPQVLHDLELDVSFLVPLYKDVQTDLEHLPALAPAAFPALEWASLNLSSVRREADHVRSAALQLCTNSGGGGLQRRAAPMQDLAARHTLLVAMLATAVLVLRCAAEWLAFHLQNHVIVRAALEAQPPPGASLAQTAWRHAATRALACAHNHPLVYCALRPLRDLAPRAWRRASTWALWCGAHGGALLWFLLFVALSDWQLAVATVPRPRRLRRRTQPADPADVVAGLHAALETRLRPALRDAYAAALTAAADRLRAKLAPLLVHADSSRPSVLPLPALTVPQPVWPAWPPTADLAPVIRAALPHTKALHLAARSVPAPQPIVLSLDTLFRPAVIAIAALIVLHHLVGLLLVMRTR